MSTESRLVVMVAIAAAAALWVIIRNVRRRRGTTAEWLPEALRNATIAYVERTFRSGGGTSIVARVDRAYRSRQGLITLVELKTRREDRVHASDIIELSAQRIALSSETGEPVSPIAFVVVESRMGRRSWSVGLMSAAEVLDLAQRREDLLIGRLVPQPPVHPGLCAVCAYRARCYPAQGQADHQGTSAASRRKAQSGG